MATWVPPATFEQLVCEYDYFIEVTLNKLSKYTIKPQDIDDYKQAVYARMLETNYLHRYNPAKGSVSNYLYVLIRSVMSNLFYKNSRNPVSLGVGTVERRTDNPKDANRLVLEADPRFQDHAAEDRLVAQDAIARIARHAAAQRRGAALCQVLRMTYEGYQPKQMADAVGPTRNIVESHRRKLRAIARQLGATA